MRELRKPSTCFINISRVLQDAVQVQNLCSKGGKEELGIKVSLGSAGARKFGQAYGESSN